MPRKAARPCRYPGCPALVKQPGESYCPSHSRERNSKYNRERGSAAARGYDHNWRKLRKMQLARNPLCEDPYGDHAEHHETIMATQVDHITPLREGGTNRMSNLQSLCIRCHSKKTALEDGRWGT